MAQPPPRLTLVHCPPPLGWNPGGQVAVGTGGTVSGMRVGVGVRVGGRVPMTHWPGADSSPEQ
jgi:hypothetical protein